MCFLNCLLAEGLAGVIGSTTTKLRQKFYAQVQRRSLHTAFWTHSDIQSGWLPLLAERRIPLGVLGLGIGGFEPPLLFEDMAEPRTDVF